MTADYNGWNDAPEEEREAEEAATQLQIVKDLEQRDRFGDAPCCLTIEDWRMV